jgi:hypothetical protein
MAGMNYFDSNRTNTVILKTIKYGRHELFLNYYEYEQGQADIIVKK